MSAPFESKLLRASHRSYQRLLVVYPTCHRREYGPAMAQLFRDQCRDAWEKSGGWGLAGLWLRTLPDLVRTSILEQLSALKGRKSMAERISEIARPQDAPLKTLLRVGLPVFLLVFGLSTILTFLLPESFASVTRIAIERDVTGNDGVTGSGANPGYDPYFIQTQFEIIQSEVVLRRAIDSLGLDTLWGKKYNNGQKLKSADTIGLIKARMTLRPVRNTSLVEICVYSEDRDEAACIANSIADAYKEHRQAQRLQKTHGAVTVLEDRYQEQQGRIQKTQRELESLRKGLGISEFDAINSTPSPSVTTNTLHSLEAQSAEASARANEHRLWLAKLQALDKAQLRQVLPRVRPDPLLTDLLSQLNLAEQKLAILNGDLAANHPDSKRVQDQVDALDKKVDESVAGAMMALANQLEIAEASLALAEKQIAEARESDVERAVASRPYFDKKRELELLYGISRILDTKLSAEKVDSTIPKHSLVEIIDRAVPGIRPVRPNKPLNLFLGALGGLMLALLIGGGAALSLHCFKGSKSPAAAV